MFFEDKCIDYVRRFLDRYESESQRMAGAEAKKTK